jgi:hypothetical protein
VPLCAIAATAANGTRIGRSVAAIAALAWKADSVLPATLIRPMRLWPSAASAASRWNKNGVLAFRISQMKTTSNKVEVLPDMLTAKDLEALL